jgi:hypothetical protein
MTGIRGERGSIAPLGIGLLAFTAIMMLTSISAASLFIFQKRLTTLAEADALFVAGSGENSESFLALIDSDQFLNLQLSDELLSDERTVKAVACASWKPVFRIALGVGPKVICSHASARLSD